MTRTDGYRLYACPHCDKVHVGLNYVSFNFMAFENWSDGRSYQSLYDSRQGLHRCVGCEDFFLKSEATFMGSIPGWRSRISQDNTELDIQELIRRQNADLIFFDFSWINDLIYPLKSWLNPSRFPHKKSKKQIAREKKEKEDAKQLQAEEELKKELEPYPWFSYAQDSDLKHIIDNKTNYSDDLLRSARTLYWMYLNDAYRTSRKYTHGEKTLSLEEIPEFVPTAEQTENMLALIELLKSDEFVLKTRIGELYRELGDFDQAIAWLDDGSDSYQEKETILTLARRKIRAPVKIVYAHQRR